MAQLQTWKEAVRGIVQTLPRAFSLADVLACHDELQRQFPNNRFIDAEIRQSLQLLRDPKACYGLFDRGIMSERIFRPSSALSSIFLWPRPSSAPLRQRELHWKRGHRSTFTAWTVRAMPSIVLPDNTPVADFKCYACGRFYQLKAKDGRFPPESPAPPSNRRLTAFVAETCPNTSSSSSTKGSTP